MAGNIVNQFAENTIAFKDFIEDSIEMLLTSDRPFIICSSEAVPPTLFKKDEDGIWVAFISEL